MATVTLPNIGAQTDVVPTILPSFPWRPNDKLEYVTLNNAIFMVLNLIGSLRTRIDNVETEESTLQREIDVITAAIALFQQSLNGLEAQINSYAALIALTLLNEQADHALIVTLQTALAALQQNAAQLQSQIDALLRALNTLTEIVTGGSSEWSTESGFVMTTEDNDTIYWVVSSQIKNTIAWQTEAGETVTDSIDEPLEFILS